MKYCIDCGKKTFEFKEDSWEGDEYICLSCGYRSEISEYERVGHTAAEETGREFNPIYSDLCMMLNNYYASFIEQFSKPLSSFGDNIGKAQKGDKIVFRRYKQFEAQ